MTILKAYLTAFLLMTTTISITACSGGEANYSFQEVLDALNKNLVTGSTQFDIPSYYVIQENTSDVTTIKVVTDGKFSFDLVGGANKALFAIDPNSGKLSFVQPAKFLSTGSNTYEVVVGVVEAGVISTFTITVEVVKDITQVVPIIDYAADALDAVVSTETITQIKARPADSTSTLTFSLDADSNSTFSINEQGEIVMTQPLPDFATMPLKEFNLTVTVTDGYGNSVVLDPIAITLVENKDLIRPVVETKSISVVENSLGATQIQVTTLGTGVVDQYILGGTDQAMFTLSDTGVLAFKKANDYETPPDSFSVTVQVGDDKGNLSDVQTITVVVSDLDEKFTFQAISDFTPMEGEKFAGSVTATPNVLVDLPPQYTLVQGGDLLEIDASGKIQFQSVAQKGQVIAVQVEAKSGLHGSETLSPVFYVRVQDDPDKIVPVFDSYSSSVTVDTAVNEAVAVTRVSAQPQGSATTVSYALNGVDSNMLTIDNNGDIFFSGGSGNYARQDANSDNIYEVSVVVTDDNGNVQTSDVIKITLIIDETITLDLIGDISVAEGTTETRALSAVSAAGYEITYSVQSGYDSEIAVSVDPVSGDLSVTGVKYHILFGSNYHTFTVWAADPYGNVSTQNITVKVTS